MSENDIAEVMGGAVNPGDVEGAEFDLIPVAWYPMEIEKAEIVETKAGNGSVIKMEVCILGDKFNGRKLFPRINLQNPSEQAVAIGMRTLAQIGLALNIASIASCDQLIGGRLLGKVKVEPARGDYEASNDVSAWKPLVDAAPPAATGQATPPPLPAQAPAQAQAQAAPAAEKPVGKRPWEK
jgi:hypothetical protein